MPYPGPPVRHHGVVRVGLVLGGGGVIGMAYHAAALAAIEHDLDWDPNDADVVVGTSAGRSWGRCCAGACRRRTSPSSRWGPSPGPARRASSGPSATAPSSPGGAPDVPGPTPRLPSPALVTAWLRRPWRLDPVTAVASVIPDGTLDLAEHAGALHELLGSPWPDRELWVCAVRRHDLRRVVLGRDIQPRLAEAVAASCAIPGYFRPVDVDGVPYIDGGVRSPTNADVLRAELDLAIILSPMSGRGLGGLNVGSLVRRHARGKVEAERARLHAAGTATLLIEPGPEVIEALGRDFMSDARVADIVRTAYVDTGDQLRQPAAQDLLADLIEQSRAEPAAPGRLRRPRWRGDRAWRRWQAR